MQRDLVELEMQELEPLDAPGFWTGFAQSVAVGSAITGSLAYT